MKAAQKKKLKKIAGWSAFAVGTALVARELYLVFGSNREERRKLYDAALARATELRKPLVVLGDPDGGFIHHLMGRDFQCGVICIDPQGCGGCPAGVKSIMDHPTHALASMATNSAVIFDSGLFAFADDGYELAEQMKRVSGGNLYMFDVPWGLTSMFQAKRKRRLVAGPPARRVVEWKTGLLSSEPRTGQRFASLALSGIGQHPVPMYHFERLVSRIEPTAYFEL